MLHSGYVGNQLDQEIDDTFCHVSSADWQAKDSLNAEILQVMEASTPQR